MKVPDGARCFWTAPVRGNRCPWLVEKRISIKEGTTEVLVIDSCAGHVTEANQRVLKVIHDTGRGTWHTTTYEKAAKTGQRRNEVASYRPYLVITDPELKDQMIITQQSERPRTSMNEWITKIIRNHVRKGRDHVDSSDSTSGTDERLDTEVDEP